MSFLTERDWVTKAGLRAVCLLVNNGSHRCGYVEVPEGHPLDGVDDSTAHPSLVFAGDEEIGKRGLIPLIRHAVSENHDAVSPGAFFNVHGGITFSGRSDENNEYPARGGRWWFGFDCAHLNDRTAYRPCGVFRSQEYVEAECESLASQLVGVAQ
jgi:hypothetical protein